MVGRRKELKILNDLCEKEESSLVAIYGRRRIGKTYLVDQMFSNHRKDCIFFKYTGASDADFKGHIVYFLDSIWQWFRVEPIKEITSWPEAFIFLQRTLDEKIYEYGDDYKVSLFFDEVPWIDKHNKDGFLSALGHFWNTYCETKKNFLVIICGSNASWIQNKILKDSHGPLYNRLTATIAMKPFDLIETKEYLLKEKGFEIDARFVIETYMAFGGVAKYLSYLDTDKTINDNIDDLYFNINGMMYDEYNDVFHSLFQEKAGEHRKVVDLLCLKASGYTINEIIDVLGIKSRGVLQNSLNELEMCGFVKGIGKFGNKVKDTRYIVSDPQAIFYNTWVKPISKNDILNIKKEYWSTVVDKQKYAIWTGFMFEIVSMINLNNYLDVREKKGSVVAAGYWNHVSKDDKEKGAQIDILIEYQGSVFDIVECKYYNKEFTITSDYAKNLKNKINLFRKYGIGNKKKSELKLVMLTTNGCKRNKEFNSLNIAADITLEQLLKLDI